jgi:hypothetical protein
MLPSHPEVTGNRRAVLARLESPRHRLCDTRALARGTRAVRQRQLPTEHGHAALPARATRVYQSDSSSKPPHHAQPRPPQEFLFRAHRPPRSLRHSAGRAASVAGGPEYWREISRILSP